MNSYEEWAARFPGAAAALAQTLNAVQSAPVDGGGGKSEGWAQQQVRLKAAHAGWLTWRNNVGATPSKCPDCNAPQRVVRYGVANDSAKLNAKVKSADLLGIRPLLITPELLGHTVGQFVSIEVKKPGHRFTGKGREAPQAAWASIVTRAHGFATFSTGELYT